MNRFALASVFGLAACAALVVAQNLTGIEFKSKSGDLSIANISEQLFESDPAAKSIDFEFSGKPLRGRSDSQKTAFEAASAKGQIRTGSGGTMYLLNATLSGGVTLWQNRGSSDEVSLQGSALTVKEAPNRLSMHVGVPGSLTLKGQDPDATITAAGGSVTLSGPAGKNRTLDQATLNGAVSLVARSNGTTTLKTTGLMLNQRPGSSVFQLNTSFVVSNSGQDPNGHTRQVTLEGRGGNFTTPDITKASTGRPLTSANIKGRVTVTFDGRTKSGDDLHLVAKGDRLTMDSGGKILLTGNVSIEGGGLDYQGEGASQTVYILVDDKMQPIRYGATGDPARINFKPDGGGR